MKRHIDPLGKKKHMKCGKNGLWVVEIQYVTMPDADERLSRAIDILLHSIASCTSLIEENTNFRKEKPSHPLRRMD